MTELQELAAEMRCFADERDWLQFHDPKSLLIALVGEVGELAELMQWLPADDVVEGARHEPLKTRLGEEMGDVLLYLCRLADVLGIDLGVAARDKLHAGRERFKVADVRGVAPAKT